ncbi:MAG TPA: tRNA preQ1(34) S-adenosylmethionine ribosyltransferase-isomerase QueA [Alphaproteobacteria bacterium]
MHLSDFDFDLPRALIAEHPARPRDAARLLLVPARGAFEDRGIRDLPALLRPGDLLVLNDTRVIPARLRGRRGEAAIEVTLHKAAGAGRWRAFARPAKRLKAGQRIVFAPDFSAAVTDKGEAGEIGLDFGLGAAALIAALERHGEMPLPPYLKRPKGGSAEDRADYQTVYAAREGAVAAPTAGLHFTPALFAALAARGVERAFVTLHVGAGTFLPVKTEDVSKHVMHAEWGEISAASAAAIAAARSRGGRIGAVGSTSLRLLESAADESGTVHAWSGETRLFITPGYRFRTADMLLTNFHLPRSTLFMLVAAFAGLDRMKSAYAHAIARRYRFFSYGDACLLERAAP